MSTGGYRISRIGRAIAASLLACCVCSGAEGEREPPRKQYGLAQVAYDARYVPRHFFKPKRNARPKLFAVAGSTAFLYVAREDIRDFVQEHRSPGRTRFFYDARGMGKAGFAPALALISYGASFITNNTREKETALLLLESMTYATAATAAGSFALATERPEDGTSIHVFNTSGHGVSLDVALAASVIAPLRCQYLRVMPEDGRAKRFWKRAATVLLYSGAALTAFQRMDSDQHWAPDVFLGYVTGLRAGQTLCEAHEETLSP